MNAWGIPLEISGWKNALKQMRPTGTDASAAGCRLSQELSYSFVLRFIRLNLNSEGREERFVTRASREQRETNIKRKLFPDLLRCNSNDARKFSAALKI
jgi:hypothetical protein